MTYLYYLLAGIGVLVFGWAYGWKTVGGVLAETRADWLKEGGMHR